MSKAQLVITAVVLEGRSKSEVARDYDVSRYWVHQLVRRYEAEGPAAFEPRSRRPHTNPRAINPALEEAIVRLRKTLQRQGYDAGAATIAEHLHRDPNIAAVPAIATIWRVLSRRGFITPQPQKRPRSSWKRFEAEQPNQCWQADATHWHLADNSSVEILNIIDDHSRLAIASIARRTITGSHVVDTQQEWPPAHRPGGERGQAGEHEEQPLQPRRRPPRGTQERFQIGLGRRCGGGHGGAGQNTGFGPLLVKPGHETPCSTQRSHAMRHIPIRVVRLLVLAAVAAGWCGPALLAADEAPVVAVIACDGYADIKKQIAWVGQQVGNPTLAGFAESFLLLATQGKGLAGLDTGRPLGIVVTAQGEMPAVHGFVPVKDLDKLLTSLQGVIGPAAEQDGVRRIAMPRPESPPITKMTACSTSVYMTACSPPPIV